MDEERTTAMAAEKAEEPSLVVEIRTLQEYVKRLQKLAQTQEMQIAELQKSTTPEAMSRALAILMQQRGSR